MIFLMRPFCGVLGGGGCSLGAGGTVGVWSSSSTLGAGSGSRGGGSIHFEVHLIH
jgi:hypothetical protein